MPLVFRSMKQDADGFPVMESNGRGLGIRPGIDVSATQDYDPVPSGEGGISISPGDPLHLPRHRRPAALQGTGKDPVWVLDSADLDPELCFRPDPTNSARHGFLEPAHLLTLVEYQQAIARTRTLWKRVC
jgi:hypothetical protein